VIDIDALIKKENTKIRLSEFGADVHAFDYSSASIEYSRKSIRARSGYVHSGGRYDSKPIYITGTMYSKDIADYQRKTDLINGLLVDKTPYFITQLIPNTDELFSFEKPGETSGDITNENAQHVAYDYGFKVVCEGGINTTFVGRSDAGILHRFTIDFVTAELPFGQTEPKTLEMSNEAFRYNGTAENSQLEFPWILKLVATQSQSDRFIVELEGRTFEYTSDIPIQEGDVFLLKGIETTKNGENVSHYTNYEYFILQPKGLNGLNNFQTDFIGNIKIENYVELYK